LLRKHNDAYGKDIAGLTRRAQTILLQHRWPGNVGELEKVISTLASLLPAISPTFAIVRHVLPVTMTGNLFLSMACERFTSRRFSRRATATVYALPRFLASAVPVAIVISNATIGRLPRLEGTAR
jgi:transcriptional regulator with PAS, ATPase and Fis domain